MFKGMKDMGKLLKQAQDMKSKMKKVQKELKEHKITIDSQNGHIKIIINGEMEFEDITIDTDYLKNEPPKKIEKNLLSVMNQAIKQSKNLATAKLSDVTGGLNIPGLG